jgi:hypothetical protein
MRFFVVLSALALAGCGAVQQQTKISTPVGQSVTAGVGDVVLRSEGRESMPNAFGGADIFGRTRPTGFSTVQFGGMQGNKVVLIRSSVVTQSDATTMNSTGTILATRNDAMYIPPTGSVQTSASQPTMPVLVDWKANSAVPMMGKMIVIESASPTALVYHVE